jgi:uncharacterized protein YukE
MRPPDEGSGTSKITDPSLLKQAGVGANELAGRLKSVTASVDDETDLAAGSLKMDFWYGDLGVSLESVLSTWQSQSVALVRKCRELHEKLTVTADNYLEAENANTQNMRSVQTPDTSPFG